MMKKLRQITSLVLVLVMFFDYGTVAASYERASYAVSAVSELEDLIQSIEPEEIQGEDAEAVAAPDFAELPDPVDQTDPAEQRDLDALLQAERISPFSDIVNRVSRLSAPYRDDGYIHIYNYEMLSLIGTGLPVEAQDVFSGNADNREADAPEAPAWEEEPEEPAAPEQPEQPAAPEQPEQVAEPEQSEQPAAPEQPEQVAAPEQPEQPAAPEQPEQVAEPEQPEQVAAPEQPEQVAEPEEPEQVAEPEEPEQVAEPEQPEEPAAPEQPGQAAEAAQPEEAAMTQALGRALSRVLTREAATPQRGAVAVLAAAVAELAEEADPVGLAEEDAPAAFLGEELPETLDTTETAPPTDPAQDSAEPVLPAAVGTEGTDAGADINNTDTIPADAVSADAASNTDTDTDTYTDTDTPAPDGDFPAEPEEMKEFEEGEAAPPVAAPDLIDDPDVVTGPETGNLTDQPEESPDEPDEGPAPGESKYYYYDNGEIVRYTSDAAYFLECDIPLPSENCWMLPEDFTGSFTGRARPGDAERVYDSETDTIFIQNPLQLKELNFASRGEDPLMSGDIHVDTFGTGLYVFTNGSMGDAALSGDDSQIVTYSPGRNAVLSVTFAVPKGATQGIGHQDGRDDNNQVVMDINGTPYILIGDRQQLDAINSGDEPFVFGKVWRIQQTLWLTDVSGAKPEEIYPGDADLPQGQKLYGSNNSALGTGGNYRSLGRHLVDLKWYLYYTTADGDPNGERITRGSATGMRYTKDGNYIVFRDIDMYDEAWTPMTFTGHMYGIVSDKEIYYNSNSDPAVYISKADYDALSDAEKATYTQDTTAQAVRDIAPILGRDETAGSNRIAAVRRPTIYNINVTPATTTNINGDLCVDLKRHSGTGFFGTITKYDNELGSVLNGGEEDAKYAIVKNIKLAHGVVTNNAVYAYDSAGDSLVSILLDFLGGTLDILLNPILGVLLTGGFTGASTVDLNTLLDTRSTSPDGLATGSFAGIISGRSIVAFCETECFSVNTVATLYETGTGYRPINSEKGALIVGKGGFVGAVGSIATAKPDGVSGTGNGNGIMYEGVSQLLSSLTSLLNGLLNGFGLLSWLGLGDVISLLLENVLNLGVLIPAGYVAPRVRDCTADKIVLSDEDGKFGVGGFAGALVGADLVNCTLENSDYLVVDADMFAGGFVGVERDAVIPMTLTGIGVGLDALLTKLEGIHTNSELINCAILDSDITVQGGSMLGGFAGGLYNSYAFDCTADENCRLVVESVRDAFGQTQQPRDYVGGFTGEAAMGTAVDAGCRDHTKTNVDLLSTVTGLLTGLLTQGDDNSGRLLGVSGVEPSAIMGCQLLGAVEVRTDGSYAGGLVGHGEATYITASTVDNIRLLRKYKRTNTDPGVAPRCNTVMKLVDVHAGKNYAGGIAGELATGSGVGLVNSTVGLADVIGFKLEHTTVRGISLHDYRNVYYSALRQRTVCKGSPELTDDHTDKFTKYTIQSMHLAKSAHNRDGYTVAAGSLDTPRDNGVYVGGGIGLAAGGDVMDVSLDEIASVEGSNCVGGFVGATGPGEAAGSGGLNVGLLGVTIAKASDVLSVAAAVRSSFIRVSVNGTADEGLTVEAWGYKLLDSETDFTAGGFVGTANSVEIDDCHVTNLKSVKANMQEGNAGGFVGQSTIGGLLNAASGDTSVLSSGLLNLSDLLGVAPYMVPRFNGCHVYFFNHGFVEANCAGGFAGDFQSGFVNKDTDQGGKSPYEDADDSYPPYKNSGTAAAHGSTDTSLLHYKEYTVGQEYTVGDADSERYRYWPAIKLDCGCNTPDTHTGLHDGDCVCDCCDPARGVYEYGIPENPWSIYNIGYVRGGEYAGGWGGHVYSGALATAGKGGLSLLGTGVSLNGLLSLFDSYVPMIMYAGVNSSSETHIVPAGQEDVWVNGFAVYAAHEYPYDKNNTDARGSHYIYRGDKPATAGYAGGYIGYGSGIQVSFSDVNQLKTGTVTPPDYLEEVDGSAYMKYGNFNTAHGENPLAMGYAVAGAYFAGGYIGHMDVGSSAAVGDGLSALGSAVQLTNILSALNVVVSTVEHSDVIGAPGGFNVIACPRINNPNGTYGRDITGEVYHSGPHAADIGTGTNDDGEGVAYAGGFAARMSGGHTQDSNVSNFEYIIGEVAAGGYVGQMEPGSLASVLGGQSGVLDKVVDLSSLATLLSDFVPTIRNSQTTCVPCGGAVRAQSPSDRTEHPDQSLSRGMAGGYVGHMVGGQIWGFSDDKWRTQGGMDEFADQTGATVGSGGSARDVMVYVYTANDPTVKTPVYRTVENYSYPYLTDLARNATTSDYFVPVTDPTTKETHYESFAATTVTTVTDPGTGEATTNTAYNVTIVNRAAHSSSSAIKIKAKAYRTASGDVVYKCDKNYRYGDHNHPNLIHVTNGSTYFTVSTDGYGMVTYPPYAGVTSGATQIQNSEIILVVPVEEQLRVDQFKKNKNGDYIDAEGNVTTNPSDYVLVTAEGPAYHDYGTAQIYLRGETVDEPQRQCAAIRIRSVYGREHAGGYCGRMEAGSQAEVGNASLLGSLLDVSNALSALEVSYSTIRYGYVNGPMRGGDDKTVSGVSYNNPYAIPDSMFLRAYDTITYEKFVVWYYYVGQYGGQNFRDMTGFTQSNFSTWVQHYLYGYNVRAGRGSYSEAYGDAPFDGYDNYGGSTLALSLSGTAGGFVGSMWSGVICDSEGLDANDILAMRAAGGFAGEMLTRGLANLGQVSLLGGLIPLNLGSLLQVGQVLVPSVARSGVSGYQSGLSVVANGILGIQTLNGSTLTHDDDERLSLGNAGGFVGACYGGQIGLPDEDSVQTGAATSFLVMDKNGTLDANGNLITDPNWSGTRWVQISGTSLNQDVDDRYRILHPYHPEDDGLFRKPQKPLTQVIEKRGTRTNPKYFTVTPGATIWVNRIDTARGTNAAGGFVGLCSAASVLAVDTSGASGGVLQGILDAVISSPSGLLSALEATVATIKNTVVNALEKQEPENYTALETDYVNAHLQDRYDRYILEHPDEYPDGQPDAAEEARIKALLTDELKKEFKEKLKDEHRYDDTGIEIMGCDDRLPKFAGGYAGKLEATVVGQRKSNETERVGDYDNNVVNRLRSVTAREYAGGFFGLADVGSLANVGSNTEILNLINTGSISVLDVFRAYIYFSEANGLADGIRVVATEQSPPTGAHSGITFYGAAGGFGGWMNNGTVEDSHTINLNYVEAKNYAGGFIGYLGRNKGVEAANIALENDSFIGTLLSGLGLAGASGLGVGLGALNVVGSTVTRCKVVGIGAKDPLLNPSQAEPNRDTETNIGFEVKTTYRQGDVIHGNLPGAGKEEVPGSCAAGFVGYGEISQIEDCKVLRLKKVTSKQIAGGFLGRGTRASVAEAEINSGLVQVLLSVVGFLVLKVLRLGDLSNLGLLNLDAFEYLGLRLLSGGDLLMLNIGGLRISVAIGDEDGSGNRNLLIAIGSSTISAMLDPDGNVYSPDGSSSVQIDLFEANRTTVKFCKVTGVIDGYDVLGGGYAEADPDGDGYDDTDDQNHTSEMWGYAGGFVGFHESSFFSHDEMEYCDVVAGSIPHPGDDVYAPSGTYTSPLKVGPFTGGYNYKKGTASGANGRNINYFEGTQGSNVRQNLYHIYRNVPKDTNAKLGSVAGTLNGGSMDALLTSYVRYNVQHRVDTDTVSGYDGVFYFADNQANTYDGHSTYLENAKYVAAGSLVPSDVTLDAWLSDGKAKLMLGRILEENTPHEVLPPIDINNPCEDIELTIVKIWEHGTNPKSQWPAKQNFKVWQVVTPNANRELLIIRGSEPSAARFMGTYPLSRAKDLFDPAVDPLSEAYKGTNESWEHIFTEPAADREPATDTGLPDGFRYFGTDGDLKWPANYTGTYKVFQSTNPDPAFASLKLVNGQPVPVEGTPGSIPLYYKTAYPDKFVVGENVQLYYFAGSAGEEDQEDKYYPAFSFRVDMDNKLSYSADSYTGASSGTATVEGEACDVYRVEGTGDVFYVGQSSCKLRKYHYENEDDTKLDFFFDQTTGELSRVEENGTSLTAGTNGYYETTEHKLFLFDYSPYTGRLDLDYDVQPEDNDHVVREQVMTNGETFGYDKDGNLVRYSYTDHDSYATARPALLFVADADKTSGSDPLKTLSAQDYNGLYGGSSYTVSYNDDGYTVRGVSSNASGNQRYVATYQRATRRLRLYYPLDALTLSAYDTTGTLAFEETDGNKLYGKNADDGLILFRYRNQKGDDTAQSRGFLVDVDPTSGAISNPCPVDYGANPPTVVTAVSFLTGSDKSFEMNGVRYTVEYDPATRTMDVYEIPTGEDVTIGTDTYPVYSYSKVTNKDSSVDELWLDKDGNPLRLWRTVGSHKLEVLFQDGIPAQAKEDGNSWTLEHSDTPETVTIQKLVPDTYTVGSVTYTGYVGNAGVAYVSNETTPGYYHRDSSTGAFTELDDTADAALIAALDAYFAGPTTGTFKPKTRTVNYPCAVWKNGNTVLYNYNNGAKYFDVDENEITAPADLSAYVQQMTVTYRAVNQNGTPNDDTDDTVVALLRVDGDKIQVDYRTAGLLAGGAGANQIVYSVTETDSKGAEHTYYYNASGELVKYRLVDPDGDALEVTIPSETLANGNTKKVYGYHDEELTYPATDNSVSGTSANSKRCYVDYVQKQEELDGTDVVNSINLRQLTVVYDIPTQEDLYASYGTYSRASGYTSRVYQTNLPAASPVVYEKAPTADSRDRAYYDIDGNLVGYLHYLQNDGKNLGTRWNPDYINGVVYFRFDPQTGEATDGVYYRVHLSDGSLYVLVDQETNQSNDVDYTYQAVTVDPNGFFNLTNYEEISFLGITSIRNNGTTSNRITYDRTTGEVEIAYNATLSASDEVVKTYYDSENKDTATFVYSLDGEFQYFELKHDPSGANKDFTVHIDRDGTRTDTMGSNLDDYNKYDIHLLSNPQYTVYKKTSNSVAGEDYLSAVEYNALDEKGKTAYKQVTLNGTEYNSLTPANQGKCKNTTKYFAVYSPNGGTVNTVAGINPNDPDISLLNNMKNRAPDVVLYSWYENTAGIYGETRKMIVGYDANGNARYVYGVRDISVYGNQNFEFTILENGVIDQVYSSDYPDTKYKYGVAEENLEKGEWNFDIANGWITIHFKRGAGAENFHSATFVASANDIEHNLGASFSPDVNETLPMPELSHAVARERKADYSHTLKYQSVRFESFLTPPHASTTYNLAELLGLPEYALKRSPVYYQYIVTEDGPPDDYQLILHFAESDPAKATFMNRYVPRLFQITIDKYDAKTQGKLENAEFRLYRYETGYGLLLNRTQTADGVESDGAQERTLMVSGAETVFTVSEQNGKYRFERNGKYLGVNTLGMLSMITLSANNGDRLDWELEGGTNGIWNLKNEGTGASKYLIASNGTFTLADVATPAERQIKLWVLDHAGEKATRGLTGPVVTNKQVILYNTGEDVALQISTGGISGLSVVNGYQPTFVGGVYRGPSTPELTFVQSGSAWRIKYGDAGADKYLAVDNGVLVYATAPYDWTVAFDASDGLWRIKTTDGKKALSYDLDKSCFVIADYNAADDSASRFLLFSGNTKPLTPLTKLQNNQSVAIFYSAEKVKLYYQRSGTPAGTTFTRTKSEATILKTNDAGAATFYDLDEGVYYLEEVTAPKGYRRRKDDIEVLVRITPPNDPDGTDDVEIDDVDAAARNIKVHIPNYEDRLKIVVDKFQAGERSQKLGGAEFLLYRYPTEAELTEHADDWTATTPLYYKMDADGETVTYSPDPDEAGPLTTDANGYLEFTGLDDGVYYLQETKAPVDYRQRNDVMKLVVGEVEHETNEVASDIIITNPDDMTVVAHVPNIPKSSLPATGGAGAYRLLGTSLMLLALGGMYLIYHALRKRREEEENRA